MRKPSPKPGSEPEPVPAAKRARRPRAGGTRRDGPVASPGPTEGEGRPAPAHAASRGRIRVYRHGLGDCLLVSLASRAGGPEYRILIDCGVILGTQDAPATMTKVVEDVAKETGGRIDLLVITHEHWDHLSGFIQAEQALAKLAFGAVWVAWTEDPDDALARELAHERASALAMLRIAAPALAMAGDSEACGLVEDLIGFFGASGAGTTRAAFDAAKGKAAVRFCHPSDPPQVLGATGVTAYVLGPPHDGRMIRRTLAPSGSPESYGLALDGTGAMNPDVRAALVDPEGELPFGDAYVVPADVARGTDFFREHLWGPGAPAWRGIDADWLDSAGELALALDNATNNTSLVLALEFSGGDVALLVGDAQVGNWESWQGLTWGVGGRTVTGADLLARTTFYKVGHHGSHNGTLRQHGLEDMGRLRTAVIPVDHAMALKKRWGQMPLPALIDALAARTAGRVLRTDQAPPAPLDGVTVDPLFFDIEL